MTTQVAPHQLFTTGLVTMLRSLSGDRRVYDGRVFGAVSYPFVNVHQLGGPPPSGPPLAGDGADVCLRYQIDSVGARRDQAEAMADLARGWVVTSDGAGGWAHPVVVSGWRNSGRWTRQFYGVRAEGQPGKEIFVCRADYEFDWTPA